MGYPTWKRTSKRMLRMSVMFLVCTVVFASLIGSFGTRIYAESAPPMFIAQPEDAVINAGENTSFTAEAENYTDYQWQVDTGSGFSDIDEVAPYSDVNTKTLSITGATIGMNGYNYRLVATNSALLEAESDTVTLTVNSADDTPQPTITLQPADQTMNVGDHASITLEVTAQVSGDGDLSYQWYRSDPVNGIFALSGKIDASLTVPTTSAGENDYYVVVTNTDASVPGTQTASVTSRTAKVKVNALAGAAAPKIDTQPTADTVVDQNDSVVLHVEASLYAGDSGSLSYQWYRSDSASADSSVQLGGKTSDSFTVPTGGSGVFYYFVVVTNNDSSAPGEKTASVKSNVAKVTVNALTNATPPVIDTEPATDTVDAGGSVILHVLAHGSGSLSYQWYRNDSNINTGGFLLDGATGDSYTVPTGAAGVNYYYVVVTNTDNSVPGTKTASATSAAAKVTVNALAGAQTPAIDEGPADDTVDEGGSVILHVVASGTGSLSYQWYGNDSNSMFGASEILGATDTSLTVPTTDGGVFYYYVVVTNTDNSVPGNKTASVTSRIAKVTVNALADAAEPIIDSQTDSDQTVNEGDQRILSVEAHSTDGGTLTYQWYRTDDNGTVQVFNATNATFTAHSAVNPGDAFGTYYYYVVVTNTNNDVPGTKQAFATGEVIKVTVNANAHRPVFLVHPKTKTVNEGGTVTLSVEATIGEAPGTLTYQWYRNATNNTSDGTLIPDATNMTYTAPTSVVGVTYYYAVATNTDNTALGYKVVSEASGAARVKVNALTYTVDSISDQTADELVQGYASGTQQTRTISIANTGTGGLTNLSASLSGEDAEDFVLTQPASTLVSGSPATSFTVTAKDGLTAGTHAATVTIKADHLADVSFTVTQVIKAPEIVYTGTGQPASTNVEVLVNGKAVYAGSATTSQTDGRSVTTVTMDPQKLAERLAAEGTGAIITIPVAVASDRIIVALDGQAIQNLDQKHAVLVLQAKNATYSLPIQQVNFSSVVAQLGANIDLRDVKIQIEISAPTADTAKLVENASSRGNFSVVIPPVSFTVKLTYGDKTVEVSKFNGYVERKLAIPEGIDRAKITTGIVVEPDGTVRHVPSKVTTIDGKDYVVINSLTNSTYAVVWNPLQFSDVASHWAKDSVNDMGSRMVIGGTGDGLFSPDRDITRAEFAAIIVRGLGLKLEDGTTPFADAGASGGYSSAISTAYAYHLISGFEDGTFRPDARITREQAMAIIAKAMKVTGLGSDLGSAANEDALLPFTDAEAVAPWAIDSVASNVQAGLVKGRTFTRLDPKAYITRAEVAAIVQRLLQQSDLI